MIIGLKIDVDTARGTKEGVPHLLRLFKSLDISATFLFSLGPDNTGRALKRVFRLGFLKKVSRSNVIKIYGLKTLLNGVLWPGPFIGKKYADILKQVQDQGHETGIHAYDHVYWQDNIHRLSKIAVFNEFQKACEIYKNIFETPAKSAGTAGWQANGNSLEAYDAAQLLYGSDTRGRFPFYPKIGQCVFKTLQIPTTLPTLDELMGRSQYPESQWTAHYLSLLKKNNLNVLTLHAEIEGMAKLTWFESFLKTLKQQEIQFKTLATLARECLVTPKNIPVCEFKQGTVDGRSGKLAMQGV